MTEPVIKMPKKSVAERREQVLEVLIGLLNSEEGMQRVTTERLAQAVGVSEGALYRYFPSKAKMFEALIERIEQTLTSYIAASKRKEVTTEASVKAILYTIIEFARKNPGVTRILTGHALMFEEQACPVIIFIPQFMLKNYANEQKNSDWDHRWHCSLQNH